MAFPILARRLATKTFCSLDNFFVTDFSFSTPADLPKEKPPFGAAFFFLYSVFSSGVSAGVSVGVSSAFFSSSILTFEIDYDLFTFHKAS